MDRIVRGANWFFDGLNTWRVLDEVTLPEITFGTEDFTPGGHMMGVALPEELQPLRATIKLKSDDERVRSLCGREPGAWISATYYENLRSFRAGTNKGRVITLKGLLNSVKADARRGVRSSGTEYEFGSIVRYEDIMDGVVTHRFDLFEGPASVIVGGQQLYAAMATNLAISGGTAL